MSKEEFFIQLPAILITFISGFIIYNCVNLTEYQKFGVFLSSIFLIVISYAWIDFWLNKQWERYKEFR